MRRWFGTAGGCLREMISGAANCAGDVPSLAGPAVTGQSRAEHESGVGAPQQTR